MDNRMKGLLVILGIAIAVMIFTIINYYQVKYIQKDNLVKKLMAIGVYQVKLIPLTFIFSLVVAASFNIGTKVFSNRVWVPALLYLTFEVIFAAIFAYLFFKEIPGKGTLVGGFLCTVGAILAIVWK